MNLYKRLDNLFSFLLITTFSLVFLLFIDLIEGDPAIYLSFMEHMFSSPFSFGQEGRVSFGVTSPLFALIMAIFYKTNTDLNSFLYIFKAFLFLLFLATIYVQTRIIKFLQPKIDSSRSILSILIVNFLVFSIGLHTMYVFETSLITLYVSLLIYLYYKNSKILFLLAPLAYLVRPELLLVQIYFVYRKLFLFQNKLQILLISLCQLIPLIAYHLYIFLHTNLIIPSSIASRVIRTSYDGYLINLAASIINNATFYLPIAFLILFSLLYSLKKGEVKIDFKKLKDLIIFIPFFALPLLSPQILTRYLDFIFPSLVIVSAYYINLIEFSSASKTEELNTNLFNRTNSGLIAVIFLCLISYFLLLLTTEFTQTIRNLTLMSVSSVIFACSLVLVCFRNFGKEILIFLAAFSFLNELTLNRYSLDTKLETRLDPYLSSELEKITHKNDVVALYEVQLQYHIKNKVLSLDGIAGNGEFLNFYYGLETFEEALKRNKVKFFGIDKHLMSPRMHKSLFLTYINNIDKDIEVGEVVNYENLKLKKVLSNDRKSYGMWQSIYQVEYEKIKL